MLSHLLIKNLALIEELNIDFSSGLNIVTGETGAGKSIIIGAVQLILGQRAEKSLIRGGAESCEITGIFELADRPDAVAEVDAVLQAAGAPPCDDGQLIVRRVITDKSSRAFANAAPVTVAVLKELGDVLIDVHGPYDHQSLLRPARQLTVLDAFGDLGKEVEACAALHAVLRQVQERIRQSTEEFASPDMVDLLRFQVKEIEHAALRPGEDEELAQRHARVANASELLELVQRAHAAISEQEGCLQDRLGDVIRDMQEVERMDPEGGHRFLLSLEAASNELQTVSEEMSSYLEEIEVDPRELAELEERMALIQRLKRKYGGSLEEVAAHLEAVVERLSRLDDQGAWREKLRRDEKEAEAALLEAARALSRKRRREARRLAPLVTEKLQRLGFPDGQFDVQIEDAAVGAHGMDAVEFQVAPNPGEGSAPLRVIASSGEIARVMLALKTVLTAADRVPLLIFDEVDANIGGVVALTVGAELKKLGTQHQIICISHLPQIAAGGDRHFRVAKMVRGKRTVATMDCLDGEARIDELARMLGGEESSSVVRKHAAEMIDKVSR